MSITRVWSDVIWLLLLTSAIIMGLAQRTHGQPTDTGSLYVDILPAAAVTEGGQWRVDTGEWHDRGVTVSGLALGPHTVQFKAVEGYYIVANQTAPITKNSTTTITATYKAKVRGGASLLTLDIPAAIGGKNSFLFKDKFETDLNNWKQVYGAWSIIDGFARVTGSSSQAWHSIAYKNSSFGDLDYSVKIRVTGSNDTGVYVRGNTTSLLSSKDWYSGYWFGYQNSGDFYIGCMFKGKWSNLYFESASPAVKPNDWNILRAVVSGQTLNFYINGVLVYSVSDSTLDSGQVGVEFFDGNGGTLDVDYATVSTPSEVPADQLPLALDVFSDRQSAAGLSRDHVRPGYSEN